MITDLPTKRIFKRYHKHFAEFLPARWRQKLTGIDHMEQNYVTVTLCITITLTAFLIFQP